MSTGTPASCKGQHGRKHEDACWKIRPVETGIVEADPLIPNETKVGKKWIMKGFGSEDLC